MNRALALLVIGLVFGGGIGFVLAAANGVALDGHDHATDHGSGGHEMATAHSRHDHSKLRENDGDAPATLAIHVTEDSVAGWNLHLMTTGFAFAPESAGSTHVPGQGHAHVYANGAKIARVYGDWLHIDTLPSGAVDLMVTLNSNDHQTLAVDGAPVQAMVSLTNDAE